MLLIKETRTAYSFFEENGKTFDVAMDDRERECGMGFILGQLFGTRLRVERLAVGDYVIEGKICVERKTAADFMESIIDGRLFRQAARMAAVFDRNILVIEGDIRQTGFSVHPHAVKGMLTSLVTRWSMSVLYSENPEDTALHLWLIGTQEAVGRTEVCLRPGRRPRSANRRQLFVLRGLPGVGNALATRLLQHFGSVEKVVTAPAEALMDVKGIGRVLAERIRSVVTAQWGPMV